MHVASICCNTWLQHMAATHGAVGCSGKIYPSTSKGNLTILAKQICGYL
jgi:hypothetical protein